MNKKSFEVYVDDRGYARDDEGNEAFVGDHWAGVYSGRSIPRGLLEAMDRGSRSSYDYPKTRTVNQPQLKALTALAAKKPGDFVESVKNQVSRGYRLSEKQVAVVVKMLTSAKMIDEIQHFDNAAWVKAKATKPAFTPGVPGMNPQLDVLDQLLRLKPGDNFISSIRDQVARGKILSEAQLKAVRMNLYRASMKAEADLFRSASMQASPRRVVMAWFAPKVQGFSGLSAMPLPQSYRFDLDGVTYKVNVLDGRAFIESPTGKPVPLGPCKPGRAGAMKALAAHIGISGE